VISYARAKLSRAGIANFPLPKFGHLHQGVLPMNIGLLARNRSSVRDFMTITPRLIGLELESLLFGLVASAKRAILLRLMLNS
jgi:hypothetical protein